MEALIFILLLSSSYCCTALNLKAVFPKGNEYSKVLCHQQYLGTRIRFYANTVATFQLELTVSGDINPNPGPVEPCSKLAVCYSRDYLLSLEHKSESVQLPLRSSHISDLLSLILMQLRERLIEGKEGAH